MERTQLLALGSRVTRLLVAVLLLASTGWAQLTRDSGAIPTKVVKTVPADGAQGVALDRVVLVRFNGLLDGDYVNESSILVSSGGVPVPAEHELMLNQRTIRITFPYFLPDESTIDLTIVGNQLSNKWGQRIDGDGNGVVGGDYNFSFETGAAVDPPLETGTAMITGYVYNAAGQPFSGVFVDTVRYGMGNNDPPVSGPDTTNAFGYFAHETEEFTGTGQYMLRIRYPGGYSEALRFVEIMPGRCTQVEPAVLVALTPPTPLTSTDGTEDLPGGALTDPDGLVALQIPAGALQQDSDVGVTILDDASLLRDELPSLVSEAGTFTDISGVFGEETDVPVTFTVPNTYNLPPGTRVPFGKIDHDTLEWMDLRDAYEGPGDAPDSFLGTVSPDGSVIEIEFDHFCTVCTGYCLPFPPPDDNGPNNTGPPPPPNCGGPGSDPGQSYVSLHEGYLYEMLDIPGFTEFGQEIALQLGYFSGAANPSVTLEMQVDYDSTRPIERTIFNFDIEGHAFEATYGYSQNNVKPTASLMWDGTNGLGTLLPTGSYPYTRQATSLNANTPVAIPLLFGEEGTQTFGTTFPGLVPLSTEVQDGRVGLVNLQDSHYGAGWSLMQEERLVFDPDGCILLTRGAGDYVLFEPTPEGNIWKAVIGDFSELIQNPQDGSFLRRLPDGSFSVFTAQGLLQRMVDRLGYEAHFLYSGELLTGIVSPTGYEWTFSYTGGKLSAISDSTGRVTSFVVDGAGDLVSMTDATGAQRSLLYDGDHHLVGQLGSRGERTEYEYTHGRVTRVRGFDVDGVTLLRERNYQPSVLVGEITTSLATGLGTQGNPIPVKASRVDVRIDGRGVVTYHETDFEGRTIRTVDGLGNETGYAYDQNGLLASVTRPNGASRRFVYDEQGYPVEIQEVQPDGVVYSSEKLEYTEGRQIAKVTDAEGFITLFSYDSLGNLTQVLDDQGNSTNLYYGDALPSVVTRSTLPTGEETRFEYDVHGNLIASTDFPDPVGQPEGRRSLVGRDAQGNVALLTDADGFQAISVHDALNRIISLTDQTGFTTEFDYSTSGCACSTSNLTEVRFANGSTMQYVYDGLDRMVLAVDQLQRATGYEYDAEGNLVSRVDRMGKETTYEHDPVGRVIRMETAEDVTEFTFDEIGFMTGANNLSSSLSFERDFLGRVSAAVTSMELSVRGGNVPVERRLEYTHDRNGNRLSMVDDIGTIDLDYAYGIQNLLTGLTDNSGQAQGWSFGYDASRRRSVLELPTSNGTRTEYSYDTAGQLVQIDHLAAEEFSIRYPSFDGKGHVLSEVLELPSMTVSKEYGYDEQGQLTSASFSSGFGDVQVDVTSVYDEANRLLADDRFTYTYDEEGRLASRSEIGSALVTLFSWDTTGQLLRIEEITDVGRGSEVVTTIEYRYDPLGRRAWVEVNGVASAYLYDELDLVQELDPLSRPVLSFVHAPGIDEPLAVTDEVTGDRIFYHADRIGSIVAVSDSVGAVRGEVLYGDYGDVLAASGPVYQQPFGFTGRELDVESGMIYSRSRYYDAGSSRFVSEDLAGLDGGINLYAYVGNSPVNYVDPLGRSRSTREADLTGGEGQGESRTGGGGLCKPGKRWTDGGGRPCRCVYEDRGGVMRGLRSVGVPAWIASMFDQPGRWVEVCTRKYKLKPTVGGYRG